jgi:4-amino-4-deoxy-L-arabinose transferase-like glycosyltransferase
MEDVHPEPAPLGRRALALVAFAAAVTMLSRLWEGDLFRDEVLYAAVAKQIVLRHDWLNLYLGDDPYWRKPPLLFWLAAGAYKVAGISTFSAKIFPALFGVGACVALYLLARRLVGERTALLAALVLATTPRFVRTSATFRLDSGVTFLSLCSLFLYVRGVGAAGAGSFLLAGVAWGLAVMAKGPFGLTGPYLFLIYLLVQRDLRVLASWRFLASVVLGAAVCLPWHVYQVAHWGPAFLDVYLREQVVDRMTGRPWPAPPASYLRALVNDDWPWLAFLALGAVTAAQRARRGDRGALYTLAWASGFLLLLYASQGRRGRYLHQFYPAAAILSAIGLERVLPGAWRARVPQAAARLFGAAALALLVLPIPLHTDAQVHLKALRPALDVLEPGVTAPLAGFRITSLNVRAACLFYLDRDLRSSRRVTHLPRAPGSLVLAEPAQVGALERAGFRRVYANRDFVLVRRAAEAEPSPGVDNIPPPA